MANLLQAPMLRLQPVSVTRQMAAAFPRLRAQATANGLTLHHLGAGYPHPEASDPTPYVAQRDGYFRHLARTTGAGDPTTSLRDLLRSVYSYTDTLGPAQTREAFAKVYGKDFGFEVDPSLLIPTMGATGGISLLCSTFERSGNHIAYIVDAPTYTGFASRASLYRRAHFYSVDMDAQGPDPDQLRRQIHAARADGNHVAFYYTVPDGHNPGGISFSQERRLEIMDVIREEGIFAVEDAPYVYINFDSSEARPKPLAAIAPEHAVHLFTASKIGLPGPRVGFFYSKVQLEIWGGKPTKLKDVMVTEASGDILLHNPEALRAFEAYLMDENFEPLPSLWPIAATKNAIYRDNRDILLGGLQRHLGDFGDEFEWTVPNAGFFSVFTFKKNQAKTDQDFIEKLIVKYGVVTIPMFGFYTQDAKERDPNVGLNQIRLSFSFNEGIGHARRQQMHDAVDALCAAVRTECRLPPL